MAIDSRLHRRLPAAMHVPSLVAEDSETLTRIYAPRTRIIVAGIGLRQCSSAGLACSPVSRWCCILQIQSRGTKCWKAPGIEVVPIPSVASVPAIHADRHTAVAVMFHDHEWETDLLPLILRDGCLLCRCDG